MYERGMRGNTLPTTPYCNLQEWHSLTKIKEVYYGTKLKIRGEGRNEFQNNKIVTFYPFLKSISSLKSKE